MALFLHCLCYILIVVLVNHVSVNWKFPYSKLSMEMKPCHKSGYLDMCGLIKPIAYLRDDKKWWMINEIKYMEKKAVLILLAHCTAHMGAVNTEL